MADIEKVFLLYVKGMAMGAADVVPGVSGGTIAFLTGIYEELINSIRSVGTESIKILLSQGPTAFWGYINGGFLLVLMLGIVTSIASLAKGITFLIGTYPILLWSFFFGLILMSSLSMARKIERWNLESLLSLLVGIISAYLFSSLTPSNIDPSPIAFFLSGALAICAMILPGISGSFILLLMGMYSYVIEAIEVFEIGTLIIFATGCVTGLMLFSRFISLLLDRYHGATMALLMGFMLGSLNKIWPWKNALISGAEKESMNSPIIQENITPFQYAEIIGQDHQLGYGLIMAFVGILFVLVIEYLANRDLR